MPQKTDTTTIIYDSTICFYIKTNAENGIRTHAPFREHADKAISQIFKIAFQACALDHSAISAQKAFNKFKPHIKKTCKKFNKSKN